MATRFYLPSTGTGPFSPSIADGGWEQDAATGFAHRMMYTTKQNSALTVQTSLFGSTSTSQTRFMTWTSLPLAPQQISGNGTICVNKAAETSVNGDAHLAFAMRLVTINGAHRATLGTLMGTGSGEFALIASASSQLVGPAALTTTRALEGDRLILEIGIHGITPANENMQFSWGDPTATGDHTTDGSTSDLCPWFEFSNNLYFQDGSGMAPWFFAP